MKHPYRRLGRALLLLVLLVSATGVVRGQLFSLSNPLEMPLLLNPAQTGNSEHMRLGIVGQSQWMSLKSPYNSYGAAFDMHFGTYDNHNLGISVSNDVQGTHVMQIAALNLYYAYMFDLTYELRMRIGAGAGAVMKATNYNKLIFSDQLGEHPNNAVFYRNQMAFAPDFSAGISLDYRDLSVGAAVHHIAEPSFEQGARDYLRVKRKATVHALYRFNIFQLYRFKRPLYLTPYVVAKQQMRHVQIAAGLGVEYIGVKASVALKEDILYRQHIIYATIGYDSEFFGALYTYGISLINKGPSGLNASIHELTLHFNFPYPRSWNMFSAYSRGRSLGYTKYSRKRSGAARSRQSRR